MLLIPQIEEIQGLLSYISSLIDLVEKRDPDIPRRVSHWLKELEEALAKNRLPVHSEIASLRGILVAVERGAIPPDLGLSEHMAVRKRKTFATIEILRKANEAVFRALRVSIGQLEQAELLATHLVALGKGHDVQLGSLKVGNRNEELARVWEELKKVRADMVVHLEGLVGKSNAMVLVDRAYSKD